MKLVVLLLMVSLFGCVHITTVDLVIVKGNNVENIGLPGEVVNLEGD